MPRFKDERPAVRVYTVCDESKYLIVRNVPALGCGDELQLLFAKYGEVEECKPMDAEECEPFTDVYWIKFCQINNARFAKRKLDEFAFLGHRLQISYAPNYESLSDTKEKLEGRRKEVLARLNPGNSERYGSQYAGVISDPLSARSMPAHVSYYSGCNQSWDAREPDHTPQRNHARVSSNEALVSTSDAAPWPFLFHEISGYSELISLFHEISGLFHIRINERNSSSGQGQAKRDRFKLFTYTTQSTTQETPG